MGKYIEINFEELEGIESARSGEELMFLVKGRVLDNTGKKALLGIIEMNRIEQGEDGTLRKILDVQHLMLRQMNEAPKLGPLGQT